MSSKKPQIDLEKCPKCKRTDHVGFLGGSSTRKFFCSDCCVEFQVQETKTKKKISSFGITSSGTVEKI